uniref:Uncharacterized protein n=1 Tax=Arundo donax TaxID=35708 RepID=A0A0A9FWF7_ARUDO
MDQLGLSILMTTGVPR